MNDENTIYDAQPQARNSHQSQNEETQFTQTASNSQKGGEEKKKSSGMRQATAGLLGGAGGAGIAMGAMFIASKAHAQPVDSENGGGEDYHNSGDDVPAWVDEEVHVATSVNDEMGFNEAFQAARAEVGPGGAFEWHGQVYNTYTADEWNQMTAEERAEYSSHFNWSEHQSDYVAASHPANDDVQVIVAEPSTSEYSNSTVSDVTDEAVVQTTLVEESVDSEPEVQILGVVHDDESGANIGGMIIDGHEAMMVDVDGDMQFEILGVDVNDNQQLEENEIMDIADAGITVDDMGGLTPVDDTLQTSDVTDTTPDIYEC